MPAKPAHSNSSSLTAGDVFFLMFRHRWRIILGAFLGVAGAMAIYLLSDRTYVSEAKILVRSVAERASLTPASRDENIRSPDAGGQTIISSEIEILTSRDLVEQVVRIVRPEKILEKLGGGNSPAVAEAHVLKNLKVEVPPRSSVIAVSYEHPDPAIAQSVLRALVKNYIEKHLEVHRAPGAYAFLQDQTEFLHNQVLQTEARLHGLRTNAGLVGLDKEALTAELTRLRSSIMQQEADLEGRRAAMPKKTAAVETPRTNAPPPINTRDVGFYKSLAGTIEALRAREIEALSRYTPSNPIVIGLRAQIADLTSRREAMEMANPALQLGPAQPLQIISPMPAVNADPILEIAALEARSRLLITQYERLHAEAEVVEKAESEMADLQRQKAVQEENYHAFATSLERARIDQAIDASKQTSISVVQAASAATLNPGRRTRPMAAAAGGGLAFGFVLAFLAEFVFRPTVKRPADFRTSQVPLMLSIPLLEQPRRRPAIKDAEGAVQRVNPLALVSDYSHPMRPYFDAIRDRLLVQFEGNPRKPKLVGVTSCSKGAGGSSVAAGVAAALSETGDGNVLLVDLNYENGSAHEFFKGRPVCGLTEAVEEEKRSSGLVRENLYLASINQEDVNASKVPSRRIADMIPRLRTSDYDYIIFDMPPVADTGITFRMSGYMDKVLVIVDSERTPREVLRHAASLLSRAKANAEAVLNRQRHVPRFLAQQLNGAVL